MVRDDMNEPRTIAPSHRYAFVATRRKSLIDAAVPRVHLLPEASSASLPPRSPSAGPLSIAPLCGKACWNFRK